MEKPELVISPHSRLYSSNTTNELSMGGVMSDRRLVEKLEEQHPIHGLWGRVYERWGGEDRLLSWADENPTKFVTLMTKMVPTMSPINTIQGDVNIVVNPALQPSKLDLVELGTRGEILEGEVIADTA
jgi:hypothetical protein